MMGKKIGRKLLAFVGIVTVGQLVVFHHYNSLFASAKAQTAKILANAKTSPKQQQIQASNLAEKEKKRLKSLGYRFVTISPDKNYATYLDDQNVLHIEKIKTHQDTAQAKDNYTVKTVSWIQDKNNGEVKVFVGEQIQPGEIYLKTVDAVGGLQSKVHIFSGLSPDAEIKKIAFSFNTGDIYILINTSSTSAVYHIGRMRNIDQVPIGGRFIKNIAVSQTNNQLYFEDRVNGRYDVLYFTSGSGEYPHYVLHTVKWNAALVQVVGDVLYYGDINSAGLVTSVYSWSKGQSTLVSTLNSPTVAAQINILSDGTVQVNPSTT